MIIRHAISTDAGAIATCLLMAMEDIVYGFTGHNDAAVAYEFLHHFTQREKNQYSWQNCWLAEVGNAVVGAINVYDGAALPTLRQPVVSYIQNRYSNTFFPEDETAAGEWYIDSLGVLPAHRAAGVGTALLRFLIDEYVNKRGRTLGLLVEEENNAAKRLYQKLGFSRVNKRSLFGKSMEHLQRRP